MDELTRAPERILIDCLRALDGGATSEDCFARYPTRAADLRGVLDTRAQLLTLRATAPSPTTFASGREALLARVVRPLASSHPGSMETQGRQARGLYLRPATRAAFAGALLFAMASCAIGVSATPVGEQARDALPDIPTIELPEQRAPYPFPEFNSGSPDVLPTEEPQNAPVEVAPSTGEPAQSVPDSDASDIDDTSDDDGDISEPEPVELPSPNDIWLPPINAHEDEPLLETPEPQESSIDDEALKDDDKDEKADGDADDAKDDNDHADDDDAEASPEERGKSNSQNNGNGNPHDESSEDSASNLSEP